jgi:hypothetical protein
LPDRSVARFSRVSFPELDIFASSQLPYAHLVLL